MYPQSQLKARTVTISCYFMTLTAIMCFFTMGCGGGGGDSSSDGGGEMPQSVTYSGLTTPALITEDNAETISAGALSSGSRAENFSDIASLDNGAQGTQNAPKPFLYNVSKIAKEAIEQIDFKSAPGENTRTAVNNKSDTISGACGGSAAYSIQVDTDTGAFSGNISFIGYCEEGMIVNGDATLQGLFRLRTETVEVFTFDFNYITGTSGSESITMDGQIEYRQSGSTIYMTMNMAIQDNNRIDYACKVENFQVALTEGDGTTDLDLTGRFYDPDYGYVDVDTTSILMINDDDDYPNSGAVIFTGELGAAGGATKARLTALSETQYQVEADTNGDGAYDFDSGAMLWNDLDATE
jgi:hypothetical protein